MTRQITHETKKNWKLLVGVHAQNDNEFNFDSTMEELKALSLTCRLDVKGQVTQNREQVDHKYYVGKGKIDELKALLNSMI